MSTIIQPNSSWNLPPTANQTRCISRLCAQLHINAPLEETVRTRDEARLVIVDLIRQANSKLPTRPRHQVQ